MSSMCLVSTTLIDCCFMPIVSIDVTTMSYSRQTSQDGQDDFVLPDIVAGGRTAVLDVSRPRDVVGHHRPVGFQPTAHAPPYIQKMHHSTDDVLVAYSTTCLTRDMRACAWRDAAISYYFMSSLDYIIAFCAYCLI
jgi:hypothetical protein